MQTGCGKCGECRPDIKKLPENIQGVRQVVPPGFEPGLTEPKPAVLPLHNGTSAFASSAANVKLFLFQTKKSTKIQSK